MADEDHRNDPDALSDEGRSAVPEGGSQRFRLEPVEKKAAISSAEELLLRELLERAKRANQRLRQYLEGVLVIDVLNLGKKFVCDWTGPELKTAPATSDAADCTIHLNEEHLLSVASGDLNPQVAMLSDKIKIEGKSGLAVYFFNLIAPRASI